MNYSNLKKCVLDKSPWIYENWPDGSEHYTCFWCDSVYDEYVKHAIVNGKFTSKRLFTQAIHNSNCLYKILTDERR